MRANLKITAMVLTALFALSAVGVSAAQAASSLDVGATPAWITFAQIEGNPLKLTLKENTGGAALCTIKAGKAELTATTNAANVTEATLTPHYQNVTFCGLAAVINVNGCRYTLTSTITARIWNTDITSCTKPLEIVQGTCVVKIGNQNNLADIQLINLVGTTPTHLEANVTLSMIAWSGGAGCPLGIANVNGTNAELTGPTTVKAFTDTNEKEGAQVILEAT